MTASKANDMPIALDEQLSLFGEESLSNAEIFSLALGKSVRESMEILESAGSFGALFQKTQKELCEIAGIGPKTAQKIFAMGALFRRTSRECHSWKKPIRSPADLAGYLRKRFGAETQERFIVIALDSRQRVLFVKIVAIGSLAQVDTHPREIFRPCIRQGAHSILMAHNHPSGDCGPSQADVKLTHRMCEVGKLVGIPVLDHLVFSEHDHCSLASLGLVESA